MRGLTVCLALGAGVLLASAASAQTPSQAGTLSPALSPRNANYSIDVRLDPASRSLIASEVILWRNITSRPASELQFHLYWNAWRNDRSTFLREAALAGRGNRSAPGDQDWSRIEVTALQLLDGAGAVPTDLAGRMRFIAPDDGNADDATVMAVGLPRPIGPGQGVTLEVKWTAHVPRAFARTGVIGNDFFIAQWFPKLGVLQDEGWNCHQFHAATEFFSDYGVYDVNLTVPRGWTVGATGVERERRDNADGTSTHRYYQEDVHDFAWTTSPDYVERVARFEDPRLPAVDLRLLLQPEHASQAAEHFKAAGITLKHYGEWFGAYPYGHLTIVDPAYQSDADGMEYPTLITAGTRWLAPSGTDDPDDVVVHEAGHQFWYGIVGNNEFEDAWLDEGINTFATARARAVAGDAAFYSRRYFGGFVPFVFRDVRLSREIDGNRLAGYRRSPKADALATPTFQDWPSTAGNITYAKTALWLNTLERWRGWPTLQRTLAIFFARWRFRHPRAADFFAVATEVGGRDLTPFLDEVYRGSNVFDYGVQDFSSAEEAPGTYRTSVVVRRYGEAIFPVDVLVTFRNGERVLEHWNGRDRWKLYQYDRPARAVTAAVDPNHVLLLDLNYTNNTRTLAPRGREAATKWAATWMVWLEDALLTWGFLV